MDHSFCPGARILRQPKPETISCPSCGAEVEIWSDEIKSTCPECKKTVMRDVNMSCLDWCKRGQECVGTEVYGKYMQNKAITIKQKLLEELKKYFGDDKKRINHAEEVLHFTQELLKKEKADSHIVIPASILHDVGIKVAEEKYGSSAGHYQEKEGPPIAKKILFKMGLKKEDIEEICDIIAHHHSPGNIKTQNFRVLYDADCLVNMKEMVSHKTEIQLKRIIDKMFLTNTGKKMAEELYLKQGDQIKIKDMTG